MFDDLAQILKHRKGEVVYVPNIGNAGDAFIAHSTYQFLQRYGIAFEMGNLSTVYPGRVIICAGGGNLVAPYRDIRDFIERNLGVWHELVILPHTIRSYPEIFHKFSKNCFVFCRERVSYDFVRSSAPNANAFLSHDLAFQCDFSEAKRQRWMQYANQSIRYFHDAFDLCRGLRWDLARVRSIRKEFRRAASARIQADVLNAFRTDIEHTAMELPPDNIDISQILTWGDLRPTESLITTLRMLRFLSPFRIVNTNRLHVGIMSAMLGKEVNFYDNSYGKNRDVFVHSIQNRFLNVHWHDLPGRAPSVSSSPRL